MTKRDCSIAPILLLLSYKGDRKRHDIFCSFSGLGANFEIGHLGTPLVVQRLRLNALNAGGPDLIPGHRTRSCMPQLRARMPQLKITRATTETQCSQINKLNIKKRKKERNRPPIPPSSPPLPPAGPCPWSLPHALVLSP